MSILEQAKKGTLLSFLTSHLFPERCMGIFILGMFLAWVAAFVILSCFVTLTFLACLHGRNIETERSANSLAQGYCLPSGEKSELT